MKKNFSNILIVNGSLRSGGNTDSLLKILVDKLKNENIGVTLFNLREHKINGCIGCYDCIKGDKCSQNDDMNTIRMAIERSKLIIFASPIYFCGVTGLMKTFIDRLFYFYHPHNKLKIEGKNALIFSSMNQTDFEKEAQLLIKFYKILLKLLGINIIDMVFFTGLMENEDIYRRKDLIEKVKEIALLIKGIY